MITTMPERRLQPTRVSVLTSPDECAAHIDKWTDLTHRAGFPHSPVAQPTWLRAWWQHRVAAGVVVQCFLAYEDGQLVAAVPMEFLSARYAGLPVRKASTTNLQWGWTSAVVDPSADRAWVQQFVRWLLHGAPKWSATELGAFPHEWDLTAALVAQMRVQGLFVETFERTMDVLDLPGSVSEFLASRRSLRKNERKHQRRAAEAGLTTHHQWDPDQQTLARTVSAVSRQSWQGQLGVSVDVAHPGFYQQLVDLGVPEMLLTWVEDREGKCLAYDLCVAVESTLHNIDTGFVHDSGSFSPGSLATMRTIHEAVNAGMTLLDLGEDAEYKHRLHPRKTPATQILASRGATSVWARCGRAVSRSLSTRRSTPGDTSEPPQPQ